MPPESSLPPSSPNFTPPPGFDQRQNTGSSVGKNRPISWVFMVLGIFLGIFVVLLVIVFTFAPAKKASAPQNTNDTSSDAQSIQDRGDCTETFRQFSNTDLGFRFCYPETWGDVSVQDARFDAADTGSRYRLTFSKKSQVHMGLQSDDWATATMQERCEDPAKALPDFSVFDTSWSLTRQADVVTQASRSIEIAANNYLITEDVGPAGVCLRGYEIINGRAFRYVAVSYAASFQKGILSPQQHIDKPNELISRAQRTDFTAVVKSIQAL